MSTSVAFSVKRSLLVAPDKFLCIFNKADEYHHRRSGEAEEEHHFKYPHGEDGNLHSLDCSVFSAKSTPQSRPGAGKTVMNALREFAPSAA